MRAVVLCAVLVSTVVQAEAPAIQVSGANFRPIPLAVAAPRTQDEGARSAAPAFDEALSFDLSACGLFKVLDRKSFLAPPQEGVTAATINFSSWGDVGAEGLVKSQLALDGEILRADLRFFTVASGKEELVAKTTGSLKDARRLAHSLANALYKYLTKETGPFETRITFAKKTSSGKDVYISDWDGKNALQLVSGGINVLPAFNAAGTEVAFTTYRRGKPEIYAQKTNAGSATAVITQGRMATGAAYSPDGRKLAYSLADGESAQLWVADADGSNPQRLTNTPYFINSSPSWSPDGKRIAFVSNRQGSPQIFIMSADGGEPKRITFQGNYNQTPDWSPRGDQIAFTARDERNAFDLFLVAVEGGKITRLTQDQGNNEEPSFSSNGRLILFTSNRNGWPQLFVMTADGQQQTALPLDKGAYLTPDWGP